MCGNCAFRQNINTVLTLIIQLSSGRLALTSVGERSRWCRRSSNAQLSRGGRSGIGLLSRCTGSAVQRLQKNGL